MSTILDTNKIDIISPEPANEKINLIIADHLSWIETTKHLLLLQDKINAYLSYLESGEIYEKYPESKDFKKVIKVVGKYPLNNKAREFYDMSIKIIQKAGFDLVYEIHNPD